MKYVSTRDQLADLLTKSLPRDAHRRMMYLIMGNNPDVLLHSQEVSKVLPDHLYDFNSGTVKLVLSEEGCRTKLS